MLSFASYVGWSTHQNFTGINMVLQTFKNQPSFSNTSVLMCVSQSYEYFPWLKHNLDLNQALSEQFIIKKYYLSLIDHHSHVNDNYCQRSCHNPYFNYCIQTVFSTKKHPILMSRQKPTNKQPLRSSSLTTNPCS